jgi:hypothetical protein
MAVDKLLRAIGTLHCPHCQMPLFANACEPAPSTPLAKSNVRFVAPFIMLVDNAFPAPERLIDTAEQLDLWTPSAVVGDAGTRYGDHRTNDLMLLSGQLHEALAGFESALQDVFHSAALAYAQAAGHLRLRSDLGYQLLRYGPGQHFNEHVDELPGPSAYGQRQVTAILYLNDDFEGGALVLPHQELVYTPKAGSLMLFPSSFCFPHASSPVTRGTKYSVVTWFI